MRGSDEPRAQARAEPVDDTTITIVTKSAVDAVGESIIRKYVHPPIARGPKAAR